jgi:phosphoribosylanthranilate isomerase
VIHVRDEGALAESRQLSPLVDAILLDSGNPSLSIKELGGTGRAHDWAVSRKIRDAVQVPVFLAGGLNPGNVGQAIAQVQPFGVDVCSGLRTEGRLDATKLEQFMRAVREAAS